MLALAMNVGAHVKMTQIRNILIGLSICFLLTSLNFKKEDFRKYSIESGFLTYELTHFLSNERIEQNVYFTNYGANEYFEFTDKTNPRHFSILKQDSVQYLFLSDSMAIKHQRTSDNIFEDCVFDKNSQLYSRDFEFLLISDTVYLDRKCQVYKFEIDRIGQEGTAIVWNNIPLNIQSELQGMTYNVVVTMIDTNSNQPMRKTKLHDFVDYE
tara:strand:- start:4208 stop:4843 length:636 start_codon:yes stop_codon:yes gene_type:complete